MQPPKRILLNLKNKTLCPIEEARLEKLNVYERAAQNEGRELIAGLDEVGRGCLAGPVVAAACVIPDHIFIVGVNDSKQLTAGQREEIYEAMISQSEIHIGIGIVDSKEIDSINIYQASIKAMLKALKALTIKPDYLLVDGMVLPHKTIPSQKIIKGDSLSKSIAAASVVAKVTRDRLMINKYHKKYPKYGFDKHKGYGTELHLNSLNEHGPCPIHRYSFEPVRESCQLQFAF